MPWLTYDPPLGSVTRAEIDHRCKSRRSTNATRVKWEAAYGRQLRVRAPGSNPMRPDPAEPSPPLSCVIVCGADTTWRNRAWSGVPHHWDTGDLQWNWQG